MLKGQSPGGAKIINIDAGAETGTQIIWEQAPIRGDLSAPGGGRLVKISILASGDDQSPPSSFRLSWVECVGATRF